MSRHLLRTIPAAGAARRLRLPARWLRRACAAASRAGERARAAAGLCALLLALFLVAVGLACAPESDETATAVVARVMPHSVLLQAPDGSFRVLPRHTLPPGATVGSSVRIAGDAAGPALLAGGGWSFPSPW